MICPKCKSKNTTPCMYCGMHPVAYRCKKCGEVFPITYEFDKEDYQLLGSVVPKVIFDLNTVLFKFGDKNYVPRVEKINGKNVIVLEEKDA